MGTLGSLSKSATEVGLVTSEWILLLLGVALVIGLIGERKTDEKHTEWQRNWYKRFELIVIIGVLGELIGDGGIFVFSGQLQTINEYEIACLNRQAAEANERTAKLKVGVTKFARIFEPRNLLRSQADLQPLKRFDGTPLWLQGPSEPLDSQFLSSSGAFDADGFKRASDAYAEAGLFTGTFQDLSSVGWKIHGLPEMPGVPRLITKFSAVLIWSHTSALIKDMPSISPYVLPLDIPEQKGWAAAEALTQYLRNVVGTEAEHLSVLGSAVTMSGDVSSFPADGVWVVVGVRDTRMDLDMFESELRSLTNGQ